MNAHGSTTGFVVALAALSVSGNALANHNPEHTTGKGPKSSIEITNTCKVVADEQIDSGLPPEHFLEVTAKIEDTSDDDSSGFNIVMKDADGQQLVKSKTGPKKPSWGEVGALKETLDTADGFVFKIALCQGSFKLDDGAKALNATVQIMTDDGANVISRCDDIEGTDEDESIVLPVDDSGDSISCTVVPVP